MFWGLIMESGKRYTQTVERAFHVSMACLEPNTADTDNVSVMLAFDNREFILCNLNKHKAIQTPLDLNFQSGDKIAFMSSGKGRVHLTGYLLETDDDDDDDEEDEDEEEEDAIMNDDSMDIEALSKKQTNDLNKGSGKRKNEPQLSKAENKKAKLAEPESDEDDEDDDDDDLNLAGDSDDMLEDTSEDEDEDDEDGDDDDDDDDDESEEEMQTSPKPQQQQQKTPLSKKKEKKMAKTPNETPQQHKMSNEKQKTPNQKEKMKNLLEQQQNKKTPNEKQQQKNKTPNEKHQQGGTPKQSPGSQVNGITQQQSGKKNKKGMDTPKGGKTPGGDSPQKKVLEGGVIAEEIRVGNGPVAKPGRQVTVYYVGRLKHNNKQFDSTTEGSGFKFRLGRGEVIKGWDIGLSGMKVGGKRKITCPAALAYGNKGSPPAIPPNSPLVFEVELRAVN